VPVKLGFIILSIIGVLRIPEEFYLFKDKDKDNRTGQEFLHKQEHCRQYYACTESLLTVNQL
jgi:hypothetical protein